MASNWWEDGATDPVKATPAEAPKKAVQEAAWWEDGDTPEDAVIPVQAAPVAPIAEGETPFPAMLDSALERVGGRLGLSDENYRIIGGDNQAVPKLLRPLTDVVPDLVNLGVKAFTGMGVGIDVGAQLLDGAAKELGLDEALAMPGGVKFKPGSIAYDMFMAFPGLGMELGHLPGGRFRTPARDVLPAEVRAALNEQTDTLWAQGATPAEINRFNVKNGLRPYNKEELAQLEEAARVRDEARAAPAAEPDVVAPDVPVYRPNTVGSGDAPVAANDGPIDFTPSPRPEFGNYARLGQTPFESQGMMDFRHRTELNNARENGASLEELDAIRAQHFKDVTEPTGPVAPKEAQDAALEEWLKADEAAKPEYNLADDASKAEVALWFKGQSAYYADIYRKEAAYHRSRGDERQAVATETKISNRTFEEQARINRAYYASDNDNHWEAKTVNWDDGPDALDDILKDELGPDAVPPRPVEPSSESNVLPFNPPEAPVAVPASAAPTEPTGPTPPKTPPTASEKLMAAMSGVEERLTQQSADRSTELSKRAKKGSEISAQTSGKAGMEAEKEAFRGRLPTETAKNIRDKFTEQDILDLENQIKAFPEFRYFDTWNARVGLHRLLDGDLPRPFEVKLLTRVYGAETVKAMIKNRKVVAEGVRGKQRGTAGEVFHQEAQPALFTESEVISTGPIRPAPDVVKPVDPDKYIDDPRQGDLFRDKPKSRPPTPADKAGQIEMFSGAETTSTPPIRPVRPLESSIKTTDPDQYVFDKDQGDFGHVATGFDRVMPQGKTAPVSTGFLKLFESAKKAQDPKSRADPGIIAKLLGTVRQMKATIDLSMPGNQGWGMIAHPEFYKALSPMVKEAYYGLSKDPASYLARRNAMRADPVFKELEDAGVTFTDSTGVRAPGEEAFNTGYAQNIPLFGNLVEASDFGASTFLNELRFNVGKKFLSDAKKQGIDTNDPAFKESLASVVNVLTGRGGLGKFEPAAGAAATALFSPRFVASRLQMLNPLYYKNLHPAMRKEMAKSMAGAASISAGLLGILASMGADVVLDPKSADFAKIKTGNTRYDVFGGLTNYITLASRLATNQTTNSKGVTRELGEKFGSPTRLDVFGNFLTNKTAPVPNYIFRYWKGKNIDGTDFDPTKEAAKLALPMYVESQYDAMVEHGVPEGFLRAIPGFFGINTSTYSTEKKVEPVGKEPEGPVPDWAK